MFSKKNYILIIAILTLAFVVSCDDSDSTGPSDSYMDISPMDALDLMNNNPDLLVIDVSPAWGEGHLPGALNFQWGNGDFEAAVPSWDSEAMYLIYCHGDDPAIAAAQHLVDEGFENVYRLEGNYGAWVAAGYDIDLPSYMDLVPMDALYLINNNPELFIIDVSNMWEFGHLPGALDVPLGDGSFEAAIPTWDANGMYLIYCHGDVPSMQAAQMLIDAGFYNVYRLEGNYGAWVDAGYEIEVETYMDISAMNALDLINDNPDLLVIDVSPAWGDGHLPGAINFQWGNGDFEAAVPSWDSEAMYLIYCHGDAPAIAAAQHLIDEGFSNVYRLEGNYGAWVDAGYDIEIPSYIDLMPMDALELINSNPEVIIIDVSPAWEDGHLPGALNFQWGNGDFEAAVPTWDSEAMYLIYCHGDAPAIAAAQHLIDAGFYNVYRLEGNYGAWVDAGYPVETGP